METANLEPEHVRGEVLATVDDRLSRFAVVGVSSALAVGAWVWDLCSAEPTVVVPSIVSAVAFAVALMFLGYGWTLQLTTEGVYYSKRTRLFGPSVVSASIPLAQLGSVRHWSDTRRSSDGGSSRSNVDVIQIRDSRGRGFRVTGQLMSRSQIEALQRALAGRGVTMERLLRRPAD